MKSRINGRDIIALQQSLPTPESTSALQSPESLTRTKYLPHFRRRTEYWRAACNLPHKLQTIARIPIPIAEENRLVFYVNFLSNELLRSISSFIYLDRHRAFASQSNTLRIQCNWIHLKIANRQQKAPTRSIANLLTFTWFRDFPPFEQRNSTGFYLNCT